MASENRTSMSCCHERDDGLYPPVATHPLGIGLRRRVEGIEIILKQKPVLLLQPGSPGHNLFAPGLGGRSVPQAAGDMSALQAVHGQVAVGSRHGAGVGVSRAR